MKIGTSTVTAIYLGTTSIVSAYLGSTQVFGGASAFTPLDLFSSGAQGIWLDPSDLSTMFSDRAGTTPVTTPGTVVGLRLDKSKGGPGPDLVTNGDGSSLTGWTVIGAWGATSGQFVKTGASAATMSQSILTVGKTYEIKLDVVAVSGVGFRVYAGSTNIYAITTTGTLTVRLVCSGDTSFYVQCLSSSTATVDNISVRELPGNHAVAPTDAARPIYGVEPKGGRRNLLTWSEGFDNAVWVKAALTVTDNAEGIADKLTPTTTSFSHTVQATVSSSGVNTFTIEAKNAGYNFLNIAINNAAATAASYNLTTGGITLVGGSVLSDDFEDLGDGWGRLTLTATTTITSVRLYVSNAEGFAAFAGDGTSGVLVRKAQLELGSTATAYQKVTIAEDVTEAGVPTCHYCRYDGANNSMSTSAIDFTATDKMSVFAGVRKLSDTAAGVVVELSSGYSSNAGSFNITAPDLAGGSRAYATQSRGAAAVSITQRSSTATGAAPDSAVISGLLDISGDSSVLRRNGVASTAGTGDQGAGNYGNYAIFFGRRNNATTPFNGKDYGIIVVGKSASAGEITDTETWLAAKTAQVTL